MADTSKKPRWGRRILITLLVLVVMLVALIGLAPTIISAGVGKGMIISAINGNVNGTADYRAVNVAWFGGQSIEGLTITNTAGRKVVDVTASTPLTLIDVIKGNMSDLAVSIKGTIEGDLRDDGTTSFADLAKSTAPSSPSTPSNPQDDGVILPPNLGMNVTIDGLTVTLHMPDDETLVVKNLTGALAAKAGQPLTAKLDAATEFKGKSGKVQLDAKSDRLIDAAGKLAFAGASADVTLAIVDALIPSGDLTVDVKKLNLAVKGADLAKRIDITINSDAVVDGSTPSTINATLAVIDLLSKSDPVALPSAANSILVATFVPLQKVTGTIEAMRVPTAIAQPFLAGTNAVLARDLGPLVDIKANFGSESPKRIDISVASNQVTLEAGAFVNDKTLAVDGDKLILHATISPETVKAFANQTVNKPIILHADFTKFSVPGGDHPSWPPAGAGLTGRIDSPGLISILDEKNAAIATAGDLTLNIDAPTLGGVITVTGGAKVEGGTIAINQKLSNLFNAAGSLDPLGLIADGSIEVKDVPAARLAQLLPEQKELIEQIATAPLNASAKTGRAADGAITALANVNAGRLTMAFDASRNKGMISINKSTARLEIVPALAAALQKDNPAPIVLDKPTTVTLTMPAVSVSEEAVRAKGIAAVPVKATVQATEIVASGVPGLVLPVSISGLQTDLDASLGEVLTLATKGSATLSGPAAASVSAITFDLNLSQATEKPATISGTIVAGAVDIANLERLLGRPAGQFVDLLGAKGDVNVAINTTAPGAYQAVATTAFDQLKGNINLAADDKQISVSTENLTLRVPAAAANRALASTDGTPSWTSQGDLTLRPSVKSLRVPRAGTEGAAFDPRTVKADIALTADAANLVSPSGLVVGLKSFDTTISCDNISKGIDLALKTEVSSSDVEARNFDLKGKVTNLLAADSSFSLTNAVIDLNGGGSLTLRAAALEKLLNPVTPGVTPDPASRVKVASDLTLTPQIKSLKLPASISGDGPIDPTLAKIDVVLTGTPLTLTYPDGKQIGFEGLNFAVSCPDLRKGIAFSMNGKATSANVAAGSLDIQGTLRDLLDSTSRLNKTAILDLDARAQNVPTALADQFQGMNGMLVAALGATMNGQAQAKSFSPAGGSLALDFRSDNGFLKAPAIVSQERALRVDPAQPITGELAITKPFRDRLLYQIHPIFADIRQTEHPLKLTVRSAVVPLDGDASRLNGDIQLDFGAVQFDTSSSILKLLEFVKQTDKKTIDGLIEPLVIKIANGRVTYDDFIIHIHKKEKGWLADLPFSGDINLAAKPAHVKYIRTRIPFDIFTKSINEVPPVVGLAHIDVDLTGDLYDAQGNPKELKKEFKVGFKPLEDLKKNPGKILEDPKVKDAIGDIFKKITK